MDISAGTGVPVFASTVTRDAAFGGANKVLAEGQTCYLEDANVVQYYDGAAWATVGPAAAGAFTFITGASFPPVTSVSLPADTFTSTYDNYKIILNLSASSVDSTPLAYRLRAAGADDTTTNYNAGHAGIIFGSSANTDTVAGATSARLGYTSSGDGAGFVMDVIGPKLAVFTRTYETVISVNDRVLAGGTLFKATTTFDSMTFSPSFGAVTITGDYKVWGYANS